MKVYISGPISGLTQDEYTEAFARAEALAISEGHEPVNPIKVLACESEDCWDRLGGADTLPTPGGGAPVKDDGTTFLHHYGCYIKYDIIALLECEAIAMLPFWYRSRGANLELAIANMCGILRYAISDDYREMTRDS